MHLGHASIDSAQHLPFHGIRLRLVSGQLGHVDPLQQLGLAKIPERELQGRQVSLLQRCCLRAVVHDEERGERRKVLANCVRQTQGCRKLNRKQNVFANLPIIWISLVR